MNQKIQHLLSLPARAAERFAKDPARPAPEWFATSDPPGGKLGSGGGTAHLLVQAWRATGVALSFREWLRASRKLIVHGGGQSRRLPAYAAAGKPLIPIPVHRESWGESLDQTLLDVQLPLYRRLLHGAPDPIVAMVTSGDVLLQFDAGLAFADRVGNDRADIHEDCPDILACGMRVAPETAERFGVFFLPHGAPERLAFFLQKPPADRIRKLNEQYHFLVDTGIWLFTETAVMALMAQCGWGDEAQQFAGASPGRYELYAEFGLSLGEERKAQPVDAVASLSAAVLPLHNAAFYHMGTSRQLIESVVTLQNRRQNATVASREPLHPEVILQNSTVARSVLRDRPRTLWIENSCISDSWSLAGEHVLTGIPENDWTVALESGVCLDLVPVGGAQVCLRAYGIDDPFSGPLGADEAEWFGRPVLAWFKARGLDPAAAGLDLAGDIQQAPLFACVALDDRFDPLFLEWLSAREPAPAPRFADLWLTSLRCGAQEIAERADLDRLHAQRVQFQFHAVQALYRHRESSIFYRLDLRRTARLFASGPDPLPTLEAPAPVGGQGRSGGEFSNSRSLFPVRNSPLSIAHDRMWRAEVLRERGLASAEAEATAAYEALRSTMLQHAEAPPAQLRCTVKPDQIVWARSAVRLDLAGGWTDTPPHCLLHGGRVVNVAVDLNGQPPVQVFAKPSRRPEIVIHSIDLGIEQRIRTYEDLADYAEPGSGFALAKAAVVLAGFGSSAPNRNSGQAPFATLADQLRDFGCGIELTLLCAIPAGSGLGTSSILGATILAALSDLCGLAWSPGQVFEKTSLLEQMLTTGGGWQDQLGGLLRSVKLIETQAGLDQTPSLRWLPADLFKRGCANGSILLYYTGITRLAKNILQEIVRGMFLNASAELAILREISANAERVADALQRMDYSALVRAVRRSWTLNQALDSQTNTPEIRALIDSLEGDLAACKLAGAGGGGYMLLLAKDNAAGERIRTRLEQNPPNDKARFVDLSVSDTGLQVTHS